MLRETHAIIASVDQGGDSSIEATSIHVAINSTWKNKYAYYVKRLKSITKNNNIMGVAELIKEEGIEIGKEEGIEIGKEKGIEIGKEKGIEIGIEKTNIRIIKALLNDSNYNVAKIATMLGLSEYYVRKVKRESNLA